MKSEPETARLRASLKSLDDEELDAVLNEVLEEIRSREAEQMKKDVLSHSQKIQLDRGPK